MDERELPKVLVADFFGGGPWFIRSPAADSPSVASPAPSTSPPGVGVERGTPAAGGVHHSAPAARPVMPAGRSHVPPAWRGDPPPVEHHAHRLTVALGDDKGDGCHEFRIGIDGHTVIHLSFTYDDMAEAAALFWHAQQTISLRERGET